MGIKCLHIADMHLDSPFKNMGTRYPELVEHMKAASEQSVRLLVEFAIAEQVDLVLIVGDSFNSSKPNVRTQIFLKEQLEKLVAKGIQVVLSYGNHDYQVANPLISLPKAVHIFSSDVSAITLQTKTGQHVVVYGFSYPTNHVVERKIMQYPIHTQMNAYAIGMLHGYLEGSHSQEGVYAPFSIQELNEKHYDYWALGHIHKRMILQEQPPIIYSGNVQGLNRHETGEKGGVLVQLDKGQPAQIEWVNTARIQWEKIAYTLSSIHYLEQIIADLTRLFKGWDSQKMYFVSIQWHVQGAIEPQLLELLNTQVLKDALTQMQQHVYVVKEEVIVEETTQKMMLNEDMLKAWEKMQQSALLSPMYQEAMQSVFMQTKVRTLLPHLRMDKALEEAIVTRALNRLALELYQGCDENEN